jgi:molybdopterin converting factor small subunit
VLASLRDSRPELAQRVLDDRGEPRRVIRIFLNGSDLRSLEGLATPVRDGDTLALVIAAAGG